MYSEPPFASLALFGPPSLRRRDAPVAGRASYRRRLALLAVLAAARGRPVSRERLMGLLWPEHPAEAARHTLSESLYVLRRELGDDVLLSAGGDVALDPARMASDLEAFERALEEGRRDEAVGLYRAPFLDGFYVDAAPEFERWVDAERDRLARAFAGAVEALAEAAEAAGDPMAAAGWWRRLAAHDPYSSRVALRLASALGRGGETAAALKYVEAHAAFLREELGVGLDAELAALVDRLRAGTVPHPPRPAPEPEPVATSDATDVPGPLPPSAPVVHRRPRAPWPAAALLLVAVVAVGAFLGARREPPAAALDPHRIAVLYLDDYSPGGELGYLAAGLTEWLIHELSQVEALEVISRNGVKPYRDGRVPLDSVVSRLRVGSVVEGSVQRAGDSVQVTVQLIDAGTLAHLDSRVMVRALAELLALQGALAEEVSGALRRRLGREVRLRQVEGEAGSARALDAVLRAGQLRADAAAVVRSADARDAASALRLLDRADSLLAAAAAEAPRWVRPTVERGWVALQAAELETGAARGARVDSALGLAARALAREPGSAAALELRGRASWRRALHDPAEGEARLAAAEGDLRAAVAAEPRRASAWGALSQVVLARGRFEEADVAARRALEADAYLEEAPLLLRRLYFAALGRADHPAAHDACGRGARMFPDDWQFVECRLTLLREDASRPPRPDEAWRLVRELERLDPAEAARTAGRAYAPVFRAMVAAAVSARAGDADSARAVLARARRETAGDPEARVSLAYDEAYLQVVLGDVEAARRSLEAYAAGRPGVREYLARDAVFRGLLSSAPAPSTAAP
jgi:DNA-binding SARP family transcriptional activator/TolB-like protein